MNIRKTILVFLAAAAAIPAAFADDFVGGEAGWTTQPVKTPLTREQVQREYEAFRWNPVFFDGTVMLPGEAGYVSANQGVSVGRTPSGTHTDALGNMGAPAAKAVPLTDAERRALREQYIN